MDNDEFRPSQGSRKRSAEDSDETKSPSEQSQREQDRLLRARRSMANPAGYERDHGGNLHHTLLQGEQQMNMDQLQQLRRLQLLAAARNTQLQQPGRTLDIRQYSGLMDDPAQRSLYVPDSTSSMLLEQQLNLNRVAAAAAASSRGTSSSILDEASYPSLRSHDDIPRILSGDRRMSPALTGYLELLDQLRHQEQLNERLIQEAQRQQQRRLQHDNLSLSSFREIPLPPPPPPSATSMSRQPDPALQHRSRTKLPPRGASIEANPKYKPGIPLELPTDKEKLTLYQTLIRASLEYFKATQEDINTTVQGRRQKLQVGQIGIRCKFCAHLPLGHLLRGKGSCSYPKTRISVYQAAQNIAAAHLSKPCAFMPEEMQEQMETERHKKGASKAGQNYWVKACDELRFVERDGGLWQDDDEEEGKVEEETETALKSAYEQES